MWKLEIRCRAITREEMKTLSISSGSWLVDRIQQTLVIGLVLLSAWGALPPVLTHNVVANEPTPARIDSSANDLSAAANHATLGTSTSPDPADPGWLGIGGEVVSPRLPITGLIAPCNPTLYLPVLQRH